ncbi:hypothetical protein U1Q18_009013 [Sarracenia purpurea var. burkii]
MNLHRFDKILILTASFLVILAALRCRSICVIQLILYRSSCSHLTLISDGYQKKNYIENNYKKKGESKNTEFKENGESKNIENTVSRQRTIWRSDSRSNRRTILGLGIPNPCRFQDWKQTNDLLAPGVW